MGGAPTSASVQDTVSFVDTSRAPVIGAEWPRDGLEHVDRCPACGARARRLLYANLADRSYFCAPGRWNLFCCEGCSCAYLDPRPDESTVHMAYTNYYEGGEARVPEQAGAWRHVRRALRNGYISSRYGYRLAPASRLGPLVAWSVPRHRESADEYVRHLPSPNSQGRLLDIGCGEGEFLAHMQALGWSVEGIEPNSDAVATARARGVAVIGGTLNETSLTPQSFNAITFRLVFEHLRDPRAALRVCRDALRPGGVLWLATPNLNSEGHRLFGEHWIHLQAPRHPVLHTPASVMELLVDSGFEVVGFRSSRQAKWSFRMSSAMAHDQPPFAHAPPLRGALALRAGLADIRALRRPEAAEVMIVIAHAT
jgi:2-polyprenyl-3-methyl-5-hydroxy-6-metoxy-1,4-benzoquinol methylase